jgi:hypothetical protein
MAVLDFPSSPTLNQQYAAPNGVTYQWDGAAWIVTGGPPGQLWTASGSTLLPTDVTKTVSVPGGAAGAGLSSLILGSNTVKARLATNNTGAPVTLIMTTNRDPISGVEDDGTKPAWQVNMSSAADSVVFYHALAGSSAATAFLTLDNAANLTILGPTGTKQTGTTWANPSDPRLKTDVAPYAKGLAEVCQLEPITYHLKANPEPLCYGFDAAKVRDIFPECVGTTRMKLDPDDEEDTEVLTFDMHPILVALVTAVKELAAAA